MTSNLKSWPRICMHCKVSELTNISKQEWNLINFNYMYTEHNWPWC